MCLINYIQKHEKPIFYTNSIKIETKRSQLNSDNHENSLITSIMAIFMTGLVCSPPYVFATKPDPGFMNSSNCKIFPPGAKPANKTCC
jgi:hypothetical protein